MEKESKLRALYLCKILYEMTDEDHPLSTAELVNLMNERYGLKVYRTTIASDVEQLTRFGIDIYTIKSTQNKYFINTRHFELPELKLLIDAVESSKFITEKKSKELVSKLVALSSENKASELRRNLHIEGRVKPDNEQIYYIVDAINDAINTKKKISFQYYQYNVKKEKQLRYDGKTYTLSPYSLVWNGDFYYVVGYSEKHQNISCYRVDRIYRTPKILKESITPQPLDFNVTDYIQTSFRMFNKKADKIELVCDNSLMDAIIDRFGEDVPTLAYNLSSFKIEVELAPTHIFYSWVFGFGGKVKIKSPKHVKDEYYKMVQETMENLKNEEM